MIASRSRGLAAGLIAVFYALLHPISSNAQETGGPLRLMPLHPAVGATAPRDERTAPGTERGAEGGAPAETRPPLRLFVDDDRLDEIRSAAVGLLDETTGGFGTDVWQGTDRDTVMRLASMLPVRTTSREARDLMRRLLLSKALPPENVAEGDTDDSDFLAMRARRLFAMGEIDAVRKLIQAVPQEIQGEELARLLVESSLLAYDNAGACAGIGDLIRLYQDVFWQKVQVFCQALSGRPERAVLGLDLLREQGRDEDEPFYLLAEILTGAQGLIIDSLPDPTPLHLAMMRAARQRLPADVLSTDNVAVLRTIAVSPNAALDLRLQAAERAEAIGALPAETVAEMYANIPFTDDDLESAFDSETRPDDARARALLFRAAQAQVEPAARAEILHRIFRAARESGVYAQTVRVMLPMLAALSPTPELAWFAADAGRGLYSAGRFEAALAWFELAREEAVRTSDAATAALELWPLVRIVTPTTDTPWDQELFDAWQQTTAARTGGDAVREAALVLTLFTALGDTVDKEAWLRLVGPDGDPPAVMPSPVLLQALRAAAAEKRVGEVVLLALLALGNRDLGQIHPAALYDIVTSLREIGLEDGAQRLALEAAIGGGV